MQHVANQFQAVSIDVGAKCFSSFTLMNVFGQERAQS